MEHFDIYQVLVIESMVTATISFITLFMGMACESAKETAVWHALGR